MYGLSGWMIFGAIEIVLPLDTQLWRRPKAAIMPWQWRSLVILFAVYVLTGVAAGAISGLALAPVDRDQLSGNYQLAAMLTVTGAFAVYQVARTTYTGYRYLVIAIAAAITATFFSALVSKRWRDRVMFLSGPVTVSFLLLGPPWINSVYYAQRPRHLG